MDANILIGIFTLLGTVAGAVVGGLITGKHTVKAAKIGFEKEKMEKDIRDLANQVKSYWLLEEEYATQIESLSNNKKKTIKENARRAVKEKGYEYPNMTENRVDSILRKYE